MSLPERVGSSFFNRSTLTVARELLGQRLVRIDEEGHRMAGWIVETEAYIGPDDLACHAHVGMTTRNAVMWGPAGHAYVYFTYGMHWMLNLVTEQEGFPAAVLIRGLLPLEGREQMFRRRPVSNAKDLANGPAKLCQALGIDGKINGLDLSLQEAILFIESEKMIDASMIIAGPRVGISHVPEPWKSMPWRFRVDPHCLSYE
jgi:DNA-3-methyladenine glycosylase